MSTLTASCWRIREQKEDFSGLVFETADVPSSLAADEVLVELHAASLNYRDVVLAQGGMGLETSPGVISGSDGAGIVLKVGRDVKSVVVGDRVVTHMVQSNKKDGKDVVGADDATLPAFECIKAGLGQALDGTLTTHGVFRESCVVKFGEKLTFEQAATLSCSGITAWNSLMGLEGRQVRKGDWVLVQGTGGVSIAALQIALGVGANIIATTSSEAKAAKLRQLGAHHIINYRETPEWGNAARQLTPNSRGIDLIVDVGGNATLGESLEAVRMNGLVISAGLVGKSDNDVPLLAILFKACVTRGVMLGTRKMMRDVVEFLEQNEVQLALDDEIFALKDAKAAFKKVKEQRHFAKVFSADVAIHCGDLTTHSKLNEIRQTIQMLRQIEAPLKLVIAGNHDFTLHESAFKQKIAEANRIAQESLDDEIKAEFGDFGDAQRLLQDAKDEGIIYLEEGSHHFVLENGASLKVYASPYTISSNADWGFQYNDAHNFNIEDGTDIAITHGPPHGVMDITGEKARIGCPHLLAAVAKAQPRLHCFGHVHNGWGAKLVTWRPRICETPSHFSDIDHEKSMIVENLSRLNRPITTLDDDYARRRNVLDRYDEERCCRTSHCNDDENPLGLRQTLFVNAAMLENEELSQLPWLVDIELKADASSETTSPVVPQDQTSKEKRKRDPSPLNDGGDRKRNKAVHGETAA
ncbi:hypothetical protein S40293_01472 [Stachybotrys chartarum IBT 40293]|nr:hypothetical protein S40293_01472 [Stachybotrys chartarum IBT 40293]